MVITPTEEDTHQEVGEQRVTFYGLSWENYLQIFDALPQERHTRLFFSDGTLEIVRAGQTHEVTSRLIESFVQTLVFETGLKLKTMGSTTMNRQDVKKGAEPDCAYYITNQPKIAGRKVDFDKDPPPDLVLEIDITQTNVDKNQLYAAMGVPELWRYDGEILCILSLSNGEYEECETSPLFPVIEKDDLYRFLLESSQGEMEALRNFQAFLKQKITG